MNDIVERLHKYVGGILAKDAADFFQQLQKQLSAVTMERNFWKSAHEVDIRAKQAEIDALKKENKALRACAIKYLTWLNIENPLGGLESDIQNPEMTGITEE